MNQNKTTSREPLFHVVKRPERSGRQMLLFRLGAVALSILAGGLFIKVAPIIIRRYSMER